MTVSQLTAMVKRTIETNLPAKLHVVGEVSNLSRPAGGHLYFTLKDEFSEVRCVMWRSSARSVKFDLADGLEVIATGSVDVYEPRGQYQLYVRRLEPRGVGALELAFNQLRDRLATEGLFDPSRKRSLPVLPETVAVVTSITGAAVRDILQTIRRRFPKVRVLVFGVRVQGEGAAAEIANAIRMIDRQRRRLGGVDVMIVGRGGGSLEDLWAFNEEAVARAIAASDIPIVSAVGHEVDFTIADFVSDLRAATPTAAAERVVPVLADLLGELDGLHHRLSRAVRQRVEAARARLSHVEQAPWFRDPVGQIARRHQQIDEVLGRFRLAMSRRLTSSLSRIQAWEVRLGRVRPTVRLARRREVLERRAHALQWAMSRLVSRSQRRVRAIETRLRTASPGRQVERDRVRADELVRRLRRAAGEMIRERIQAVAHQEARLRASSHEQVLNRGFAITRLERGRKLVRSATEVREGDRVITETADGCFTSRVLDARQGELFE
ncbi:MAG: exodeoxyribonuclease VII large subunit [Phycisphaerae bacterium]